VTDKYFDLYLVDLKALHLKSEDDLQLGDFSFEISSISIIP
jgi:hypothetical protein